MVRTSYDGSCVRIPTSLLHARQSSQDYEGRPHHFQTLIHDHVRHLLSVRTMLVPDGTGNPMYNQIHPRQMTRHEIIEDLCHKVADIKYDLQQVLDTLYQLENECHDEETTG